MCLKKFKEECAFVQYRDKCFKNAENCKRKILKKYKDIDVNNLYIRIVNYQLKKYGDILRTKYAVNN